jgi:hypothetical protein
VEQFDLSGYDLVLSSSHAVAKGVLTGPATLHLSYVHSPMRYAWDLQHQYLRQAGLDRGLKGALTRLLLARMRGWDHASAARPDVIAANSAWIAERIRKSWRRESTVVHPPVDLDGFPYVAEKGGDYVIASRMVPYKRVDLVAAAFRIMPERRLVIAGDGPEMTRVREAAGGAPNIVLRGRVPQAELVALLQRARAFVFAGRGGFRHRQWWRRRPAARRWSPTAGRRARHRARGRTGVCSRETAASMPTPSAASRRCHRPRPAAPMPSASPATPSAPGARVIRDACARAAGRAMTRSAW